MKGNGRAHVEFLHTDLFRRWIGPLGLVLMLVLALLLALLLVRHHGRWEQWRLARAERKHPFAAPARTLIAFGVAAASALVFVRIGREVVEGETQRFDEKLALAMHALDSRGMDVVMEAFTFAGSPFAVIPLALAILVWAHRRKEYRASLALVMVLVMTEVLNVALKDTFVRVRPTLFEKIATLHSYSFPSGHSMAAVTTYGMFGILIARLAPAYRRTAVVAMPVIIVLIGLSRVYLGVHWPTDVLAGWAAGGFLLLAGATTLDGLPLSVRARAT